ncbi:hypothetical protein B0H16DRAFT_1574541, partial [Mycena metata]
MASTSASPAVVLPSIHEMFPEHLMSRPPPRSARPRPRTVPIPIPAPTTAPFPRSHFVPPHPTFSFDVLKSDPRGSSLQHIASSRPSPPTHHRRHHNALPAVRTAQPPAPAPAPFVPSPHPRSHPRSHSYSHASSSGSGSGSSDGDAEMDLLDVDMDDAEDELDSGAGEEGGESEEGKKHVCPTCAKRFNRPSSLRIHVNTHTGATLSVPTPLLRPCIQRKLQHAPPLSKPRRVSHVYLLPHILLRVHFPGRGRERVLELADVAPVEPQHGLRLADVASVGVLPAHACIPHRTLEPEPPADEGSGGLPPARAVWGWGWGWVLGERRPERAVV